MADYDAFVVDVDTPQPGGRRGETPRAAFLKFNGLIEALEDDVTTLEERAEGGFIPIVLTTSFAIKLTEASSNSASVRIYPPPTTTTTGIIQMNDGNGTLRGFFGNGQAGGVYGAHVQIGGAGGWGLLVDGGFFQVICATGAAIGTPTGGLRGGGTLNAHGLYINNVPLTASPSDPRLKENIEASTMDAGAHIDAMNVVAFDWKDGKGHVPFGFLAPQLNMIAPHAVIQQPTEENPDQPWALDPGSLIPMLVKEIQNLRRRVALLEQA